MIGLQSFFTRELLSANYDLSEKVHQHMINGMCVLYIITQGEICKLCTGLNGNDHMLVNYCNASNYWKNIWNMLTKYKANLVTNWGILYNKKIDYRVQFGIMALDTFSLNDVNKEKNQSINKETIYFMQNNIILYQSDDINKIENYIKNKFTNIKQPENSLC